MSDELKPCPGCRKAGMETPERLECMFRAHGSRLFGCVHCGIYTETEAAWNALPREPEIGPASKAALDEVARLVKHKLSIGWGEGDGMIIRLSRSEGEALLAERGEATP